MTPTQIKQIRDKSGLTQAGLARVIGLSGDNAKDTVRSWEDGRRNPSGVVIRVLEMIDNGEWPLRYYIS